MWDSWFEDEDSISEVDDDSEASDEDDSRMNAELH